MKEYIESTEKKHFDDMPYDNDTNLWLKFGILEQLTYAYGNEFYKYVSQEYRNLGNVSVPTDNDKQQMFMKVTSKVAHRDLTEFFVKWGLYPDEATQLEISAYPRLSVPIWNNIIYDKVEDYKISSYTPPTGTVSGILDYTVGMDNSEIEIHDILTDIKNIDGDSSDIKISVDSHHDFEESASVGVVLENGKGLKNRIELPINYNFGNAIVFKAYSNELRLLLTLQPFNHTIETFTNSQLTSQLDSGDMHYTTITLFDSDLKEVKKVEINSNQFPQDFISVLSDISYRDGMYIKVEMSKSGKLQLHNQRDIMMDFNEASKVEWFLISNDELIHVNDFSADFKFSQTDIGKRIEAKELVENITDTTETGVYLITYKKEPNWNKAGEQEVTILIKNKLEQEIEVKGYIQISYDNSISMRAYGNEERVVLSTDAEKRKFRSVSDSDRITNIESSVEQYAEVTLYDENLTSKHKTATRGNVPPLEFANSLDGISYEEGDYIKFVMYTNKKLQMYADGEVALNLDQSNKEEWFQLIDNRFIRITNVAPRAEAVTQTVLIGSKISPTLFVKDIQDLFGDVEVNFVDEPKWDVFGDQTVKIRLKNEANKETIVESKLTVSRGNSISLRGYLNSDERALVFLDPNSKKIQTFTSPNRQNVVDSGTGLYWTLTHVSGESNETQKKVSINREDMPFDFADSFSGMNYKNNDYVIVEHVRGSGFVRQYSENSLQDQLFTKREVFLIRENQFIHVGDTMPTIQSDSELTVKKNSTLTEAEFLEAIHFETEAGNQIVTNYTEEYLKVVGEYLIKIEVRNISSEETVLKIVRLVIKDEEQADIEHIFKLGYWQNYGLVLEGQIKSEKWDLADSVSTIKTLQLVSPTGDVSKTIVAQNTNWYNQNQYDGYQVILDAYAIKDILDGEYQLHISVSKNGIELTNEPLKIPASSKMGLIQQYEPSFIDLKENRIGSHKVSSFTTNQIGGLKFEKVTTPVMGIISEAAIESGRAVNGYILNTDFNFEEAHQKNLIIETRTGQEVKVINNVHTWDLMSWGIVQVQLDMLSGFQIIIPNEYTNTALYQYKISITEPNNLENEYLRLELDKIM